MSEHSVTGERILSYIERVERIEAEMEALKEDRKEIYSEAKATGFDVKVLRKLVRIRRMDESKRKEEKELLELYQSAIGMVE